MTIAAKQQLVTDVRDEIGEFLTYKQTNQVSNVLLDKLCGYEVEQTQIGTIDSNSMDLLQAYLDAKAIEGLSANTINMYEYRLSRMLKDVGTPVQKVTVNHLRNYLMEEKSRGISDRTLEGLRQYYHCFFQWLQNEGHIRSNPCANIGSIKYLQKLREPYSPTDIEKLKAGAKFIRDKAIICFLLSTGARISEVTRLNMDSIDLQSLECKVLGKGNKERTVYIDEVTAMVLSEYFDTRTDDSPALFRGIRSNSARLSPHGAREMLVKLGERAGVENVHPHRFRRTLATMLILHGMPIQEVAVILGHSNISTTMQYIKVSQESVKGSYRRYFYA